MRTLVRGLSYFVVLWGLRMTEKSGAHLGGQEQRFATKIAVEDTKSFFSGMLQGMVAGLFSACRKFVIL